MTSLRGAPAPAIAADSLSLDVPRLRVTGTWRALAPVVERTLLARSDGTVTWRCIQPRARADVTIDGRRCVGLGYAERLTVTIPPWRLPIHELRWGRALSSAHGVVWIDWRGDHAVRLVLRDGIEVDGAVIDEEGIRARGVHLSLDRPVTLRSGSIVDTVLSVVPAARRVLAARRWSLEEHKWLSRCNLRLDQGPAASGDADGQGFAIHEVVRWP